MNKITFADVESLATAIANTKALPDSPVREHQLAHLGMTQQRCIEDLEEMGTPASDPLLVRLRGL